MPKREPVLRSQITPEPPPGSHLDNLKLVEPLTMDQTLIENLAGRLRIPERRYAVFAHRDHVSTIRRTWNTIWNKWLPESGPQAADAPALERYGENFDSCTGMGDIEVCVALDK